MSAEEPHVTPPPDEDGGPPPLPAWSVLLETLRAAAGRAEVRAALRWLASELSRIAERAEPRPVAPSPPPAPPQPPRPVTYAPLRLGDGEARVPVYAGPDGAGASTATPAGPSVESPTTALSGAPEQRPLPDLRVVARRCRLKAECLRWTLERRRRIAAGAAFETMITPTDQGLIERARALPQCYLWMLDPYESPPGGEIAEDLAAAYDNVADGAELMADLLNGAPADIEEFQDEAFQLLAEAQSALRIGLLGAQERRDVDQEDVFHWLKRRTFEEQVFVPRFMRLNDPADPTAWADLQARLAGCRTAIEHTRRSRREYTHALNRIRYHAQRTARVDASELLDEWHSLMAAVDGLLAAGTPPSDRALRDLLLPCLETIPEEFVPTASFERALRELDSYLAAQEAAREETRLAPTPTPEVQRVAGWLQGRVVVLIGGERRVHSQRALERAFGLAELRWLSTRPHQSTAEFEPHIARPETALVLLAIRWASHSFEEASTMAQRFGRPFVRLPRGYGTNQVAAEIVRQVSGWM